MAKKKKEIVVDLKSQRRSEDELIDAFVEKRMNEIGRKKTKSLFNTSGRQYMTQEERNSGKDKWINRRTGQVVNGGDEISICEIDDWVQLK